jgi:malate permease and related proteins
VDSKLLIDTIRTMTVILGGLVLGYCLRRSGRTGPGLGTLVNRLALIWVQPVVMCLALWSMKQPDLGTLALPLYAVALILLMWPVSALLARGTPGARGDRATSGSVVLAGMFSNVGFTYGTFLAFVLLGANGAALASVYCMSFMPAVFTLGFFVARHYSGGQQQGFWRSLAAVFADPETRNPVLGIIAGLAVNLLHITPPAQTALLIDVSMPLTTAAFLMAIGYGLELSSLREYWRLCALVHVTKFVVTPVVGLGLAWVFGYWQMGDHSLLKVCFIEAAAPVAIMSVMAVDLFGLNRRLAGALWLSTNITGVVIAPVILLIARAL